jgi:predicted ATP-binding protein involved in virulence
VNLITSIELSNFRCFRRLSPFSLSKATFLIGPNNSGKTAILSALDCFFNDSSYKSEFLNKTEYAAKAKDHNRSIITLKFNLHAITSKVMRQRMITDAKNDLQISKAFAFKKISKNIDITYSCNGSRYSPFESLDQDVQKLLKSVSVSYILPQEGDELLRKAQEKLKHRLLQNWGRYATLAKHFDQLEKKWKSLRKSANEYLSTLLTSNLRRIWKECNAAVDLPEKIHDIIAISKINFKSSPNLPEISLASQGTGAQSTILYQTHYLLDSDRTLHRGQYYPIWLLEEPESFLHADIALKLGKLLSSKEWLDNIQMVISTHSPLILAGSKANEERIGWTLLDGANARKSECVQDWSINEIEEIGQMMGDPNFDAYFMASDKKDTVFLEDSQLLCKSKFEEAGVEHCSNLKGMPAVKKILEVLMMTDNQIAKSFFLVDNDNGKKEISHFLTAHNRVKEEAGFALYKPKDSVFIILSPPNCSVEDIFDEFDSTLEECCGKLFTNNFRPARTIDCDLSRTHGIIRGKAIPHTKEEAFLIIKNTQDVKNIFWKRVEQEQLRMSPQKVEPIKRLIAYAKS